MPAGFDIGQNSVRGGELGKTTMLQITPYNAGKKLYEDDALTLYERGESWLAAAYVAAFGRTPRAVPAAWQQPSVGRTRPSRPGR